MDTRKLRQKILDLAIRGKLVPQDPNDEPASVLLERIRAEKEQLIKEDKIKRSKKSEFSDKPHYENVPFEIPESWEWTTLGEISNYGQCENVNADKISEEDWILELEDIEKDSGHILQKLHKRERKICGTRHKFYLDNILYSKLRTYLNKVLVAPASGFCTTEIIPIRSFIIVPQYLCLVLRSNYYLDYTASLGYGVKMPRLGTNDAISSYIPIPPLFEQTRIVNEIDKWNKIIDDIEIQTNGLSTSIEKAKSRILDLAISGKLVPQDPNDEPAIEILKRINPNFVPCDNSHYENLPNGWCVCRLEDICQICDNHRKPINSSERIERKNNAAKLYPYYGATGMVDWIDDFLLDGTYILLGEDGAPFLDKYANKAYIVSGKIWVNNHAHILSPQSDISYLCHYLNMYDYSKCVNGSTRLKLTQADMKNIEILLPPLNEQYRISHKIDYLLNLINTITAEL